MRLRSALPPFVVGAAIGSSSLWGSLYNVDQWGPLGIVLLVLIMATTVAHAQRRHPLVVAPATMLGLLAVFEWLSRGWSESVNDTLVAANRTAVYAALAAGAVLLLSQRAARLGFLAGVAAGTLGATAVEVVRLAGDDAASLFVAGRLNNPLGYYNGQAAALLVAFWPSVGVAETARHWLLRGMASATAVLTLLVALLAQSRGAVISVGVSVLVLIAFVPGRRVRFAALVMILGASAAAAGTVLHVYDTIQAGTGVPTTASIHDALRVAVAAALAAGAAWAVLSESVRRKASVREWLDQATNARWVHVTVAVVAAAAVVAASPAASDAIRKQWHDFTHLKPVTAELRLTSGGGNRYDYWRIAWGQFKDHPWGGIGAGNYDRTYYMDRRTTEDVRQPHSLWLQALAETGIAGFALLISAFVPFALAFRRCARRARSDSATLALTVGAGGGLMLWLVQTSADWLHLLPGLTGVALGFGALLLTGAEWQALPRVGRDIRLRPLVFVGSTLAAASLGLLTLAAIRTDRASDLLVRGNARGAADEARSALRLNDRDLNTYYVLAAAFARNNQYGDARETLGRAASLEPHNFVPPALIGDLAVRRGDLAAAATAYRRASILNPRNGELRSNAERTARQAEAAG